VTRHSLIVTIPELPFIVTVVRTSNLKKNIYFMNMYDLFKGGMSSWENSYERRDDYKRLNWIGCGRKRSWPNLTYIHRICLKGRRKFTKNTSQDNRWPRRDPNQAAPDASTLELMCSVRLETKMDKIEVLQTFIGARRSVVSWGTMLQAGRSLVLFPMRSLDFFQLT
jgi:hypothetical protein